MKSEIKIPAVGESINEATISSWQKQNGESVKRDEVLLTLETDKANVDVVAEADGVLEIKSQAGAILPIGSVVGYLDRSAGAQAGKAPAAMAPKNEDKTSTKIILPGGPPPATVRGAAPAAATPASNGAATSGSAIDIKVPAVGESITEATLGKWNKKSGDAVKREEILLSLETDKATVDVIAERDGVLETLANTGDTVKIGSVVGRIKPGVGAEASAPAAVKAPVSSAPAKTPTPINEVLSPAVRRVVDEFHLSPGDIAGTGRGGRITKEDAERFASGAGASRSPAAPAASPSITISDSTVGGGSAPTVRKNGGSPSLQGYERRVKMTTIRKRIAERLVYAQQTAAILTTFNEINMGAAMALRARYKEAFKERYGVNLGYMGLFTKACLEALRTYPEVNAFIEDDEIVYHDTYNIGVAVGGPKGLIVPVLHHAESLSMAEIELKIRQYAEKAKAGKIGIEDLAGGTFTISNGGTYGSMMSTPILNPPQSGILGMHKIEDRPIAVNGKVEIHPMMYVALSYDHRIIDGEGAVKFLVKVKECLEDPNRLLLEI